MKNEAKKINLRGGDGIIIQEYIAGYVMDDPYTKIYYVKASLYGDPESYMYYYYIEDHFGMLKKYDKLGATLLQFIIRNDYEFAEETNKKLSERFLCDKINMDHSIDVLEHINYLLHRIKYIYEHHDWCDGEIVHKYWSIFTKNYDVFGQTSNKKDTCIRNLERHKN